MEREKRRRASKGKNIVTESDRSRPTVFQKKQKQENKPASNPSCSPLSLSTASNDAPPISTGSDSSSFVSLRGLLERNDGFGENEEEEAHD